MNRYYCLKYELNQYHDRGEYLWFVSYHVAIEKFCDKNLINYQNCYCQYFVTCHYERRFLANGNSSELL